MPSESSLAHWLFQAESPFLNPLPQEMLQVLLADTIERDRTAARRATLLSIIWQERFLTREGLVARVEGVLGKGRFGKAAREDIFYRDMRVVKQAFKAAGYQLAFSRSKEKPGYFLRGEPGLQPGLARTLAASLAELDPAQIAIYRSLTPADRFHQGCSISDTARRAVAYRLGKRHPDLDQAELSRLAVRGGDS